MRLIRDVCSDGFVHYSVSEGTIRIDPKTLTCYTQFGKIASWRTHKDGYRYCSVFMQGDNHNRTYAIMEHRLVVYLYGDKFGNTCPLCSGGTSNYVVDHINGDKLDNRVCNLQLISQRKNCSREKSIKSGLPTGVHLVKRKKTKRYQARFTVGTKMYHIGYFDTPELANNAYLERVSLLSYLEVSTFVCIFVPIKI